MNRAATVVSLAVAALLAAALAALWLAPGPQARWRQWQAPPPQAPQLDDVQTASLRPNPAAVATYPAVLERPLFNPARRPQASASAAAAMPPAPSAIEQAKLQGLVAGPTLTGVMLHKAERPHPGVRVPPSPPARPSRSRAPCGSCMSCARLWAACSAMSSISRNCRSRADIGSASSRIPPPAETPRSRGSTACATGSRSAYCACR